jgi:hypothetical protein
LPAPNRTLTLPRSQRSRQQGLRPAYTPDEDRNIQDIGDLPGPDIGAAPGVRAGVDPRPPVLGYPACGRTVQVHPRTLDLGGALRLSAMSWRMRTSPGDRTTTAPSARSTSTVLRLASKHLPDLAAGRLSIEGNSTGQGAGVAARGEHWWRSRCPRNDEPSLDRVCGKLVVCGREHSDVARTSTDSRPASSRRAGQVRVDKPSHAGAGVIGSSRSSTAAATRPTPRECRWVRCTGSPRAPAPSSAQRPTVKAQQ